MIGQPEVHAAKVTHVSKTRSRTWPVALAAGALMAAGCADSSEQRGLDPIEAPAFAPETSVDDSPDGSIETDPGASTSTVPDPHGTSVDGSDDGPAPASAPEERPDLGPPREVVSFDDPVGDAVGGLDDDPPAWSDLAGATLTRRGDALAMSVRFGGGEVPERSDGRSTMNVASFFDVDGDGRIDHELWANLGPEGWGVAWYDNVQGTAGFGDDSNVTVVLRSGSLDLLFPDVLLGRPERFRFSLASEYGELDVLGSSFARRDDAPDDDQAVRFPG